MTKISIIGAGTAVFSLNLIRDICLTPGLEGSTISFMDIDEDRLRHAHALCRRYAEEAGIRLTLEQTTDRRESIRGADFVINAALVGGHDRFTQGWEVARRHGYRFGGSLHVMHDEGFWINYGQLSLMEEILQDILEVCPNAWYMLVANPVMAGVTYLSRKYPQAKLTGFCHGSNGVYRIAETLGLDPARITFEVPGINHFIWLTEFRHNGQDAFPILDRWVEEQAERYFATCKNCDAMGPKAVDLYRKFGVFPIGDTGNPGGGAWPYWYHADEETQLRYKDDPDAWFDRYLHNGSERVERIREVSADASRKVTDEFPPVHSREPMIPFIEAIACDVPRVLVLNVMNDGDFVPGIPRDFQVEIPCYVSAIGVQGIKTKGLPKPVIEYALRDRVASVETELSAFENGSYDDLVKLVLMDPWTRSERQARNMIDEMLALPGLEPMKEHYK
ncbi:family 4 glycosyl hydrolase [Paenibacillus cymbidii]|uniref:family 4 glycosyl hydrolase n=1 Tax=Paenibacillus cymbidii TaxID=1639034 RepID=UPI00143675B7|nr:hypothetical protein [Paenibacillus cymbidii]